MVLPGTGITWVNDDSEVHTVRTTGDHSGMFTSGDIIQGAEWGYTFGANEGQFEYKDTYTNSTGVIIVRKGESLVGAPSMQNTKTG
jgi:plastocyanin